MSELAFVERARIPRIVTLGHAIDFYIAELARRGRSPSTRLAYRRMLNHLARQTRDKLPGELELEDYERFLDQWTDSAPSTLASAVSLVRGFSTFLADRGMAASDVAAPLRRPRRQRPEDVAVISVSADDVSSRRCGGFGS